MVLRELYGRMKTLWFMSTHHSISMSRNTEIANTSMMDRITISKDSMVEPEIHEKLKVMHSGKKKLIIKRIRRDVDFDALLDAGKITIENSRYCWHLVGTEKNIGMIAMKIVFRIYDHYQDEGTLPETVSLHY